MQQQPIKAAPGPYSAVGLAILCAITVLIANLALGLSSLDVGARELIDTDGYMRYSRILDLAQSRNSWFDGWIHWSNSPFGHSMHWTRPLDALVLLLATLIAPFVGWSDGVYWAALLTGPIIHLSLAGVVMWGAWRMMSPQAAALAGWVAGLQPIITGYSLVGRLDHHVLITVLTLAIFGATLASFPFRLQSATLAGCLSGIALWVSPEALLIIGISATSLAGWWVVRGGPLNILWRWSTAFMVTTVFAGLLELGPANIFAIEYDRISLPYFIIAISACISITMAQFVLRRQPRWEQASTSRLAFLFSMMVLPVALVVAIFPDLVNGPFADTPQRVWDIWLSKVDESQPMGRGDNPISQLLGNLTTPVLGLVSAIVLARRRSGDQKVLWATIAIWLGVLIPVAANSTRLALYPQALAGFPVAALVWSAIMKWGRGSSITRVAIRAGLICAAIFTYAVTAVIAYAIENDNADEAGLHYTDCVTTELRDEIDSRLPSNAAILAHIDLGPLLHVTTGRNVIATPHHRNIDGILDAYDIMRLPPAEALLRIENRGIDALIICSPIDDNYLAPIPQDSLYQRLVDNDVPPWLEKIASNSPEPQLFVIRP